MAYGVVLRRNGAKVGYFGPFGTKKQAIAQGQVLADDSARDVVVSVEPQRKKATTKKKRTNTRTTRANSAIPHTKKAFAKEYHDLLVQFAETAEHIGGGKYDTKSWFPTAKQQAIRNRLAELYQAHPSWADDVSGGVGLDRWSAQRPGIMARKSRTNTRKNTARRGGWFYATPRTTRAEIETRLSEYTRPRLAELERQRDAQVARFPKRKQGEARRDYEIMHSKWAEEYRNLQDEERRLSAKRTNTRRTRANGKFKIGDLVKVEGSALAGAEGIVIEFVTTTKGEQGVVLELTKAARSKVFGQATDEVIALPKHLTKKRTNPRRANPSRGAFKSVSKTSEPYTHYTVARGLLTSGHKNRKEALKQASGQKDNVMTAAQAKEYLGRKSDGQYRSLTSSASWYHHARSNPRKNPTRTRSNPASKAILRRIDLANKWIAFAQKHDIRGIDTSSSWHSSLTYTHKIAVSAGKNRATVKYTEDFAPGKKQSETYNLSNTDTYSDTGVSALRYAINTYIIKPIKRGAKDDNVAIPASLR